MRKDARKIPDRKELVEILSKEAKRKLPPGKKGIHYPDFSSLIRLFEVYDEDSELIKRDFPVEDFVEKAQMAVDKIANKILADEKLKQKRELFDQIFDYLSKEDQPEKSELIFVFGSSALFRVKKALELYKKGFAPLLMFSGRSPNYQPDFIPEAIRYHDFALTQGVPKKAIIIEDQSITIPDNVRRSLNLLEKFKLKFKSLILVNSPYSQRRGWVHFKKYLPSDVKIFRVNSLTKPEYSKKSWYKNEMGLKVILNEFVKMRIAVILNTA